MSAAAKVPARRHALAGGITLLLREARPEDASALLAYIERVSLESDFLEFGPGEFELGCAAEAEALRGFAQSDNQLYLLGLIGEEIVAALVFSASARARVRHSGTIGMSVRREYWGQGIGALLLDTLIAWARATPVVRKLSLCVRADNQRAIGLYERKGFEREGTLRGELLVAGVYFDKICFGLRL